MKKARKLLSFTLIFTMTLLLTGCAKGKTNKGYVVGICQLVEHTALDEATRGFVDALTQELGDAVTFETRIADGSLEGCSDITNSFSAEGVDLIMANATMALKAASSSTNTIPIVATSVTDYASVLNIRDWSGTTGTNVTGTSDLPPISEQANMIKELFPNVKQVGILYSKNESNSIYQARMMESALGVLSISYAEYVIDDGDSVADAAELAASECDVIYLPTDNTMAASVDILKEIFLKHQVPAFAGEEGICEAGVATLSIDYYGIGVDAGKMAAEILKNGTNPATMEIGYAQEYTKKYHAGNAETLKVTIPADYVAIH